VHSWRCRPIFVAVQTWTSNRLFAVAFMSSRQFSSRMALHCFTPRRSPMRKPVVKVAAIALSIRAVSEQIAEFRSLLDELDDAVRLSFNPDTNRSITEKARMLRQEVARLRMKPEFEGAIVRSEIDGFLSSVSDSLSDILDENTKSRVKRQAEMARDRISQGLTRHR
jgi:hypothetical protein